MLNGLSVTIGNVKTPIFKAWHCPCHGKSRDDIETLVDKISRFLGEVRVDGSRRSLPVEETTGWRMTQQTEPPTNMTADEFNTESYHCLKHLQDFSNIVQAAIPAVMAWWEVGEHHLVPDEIEVRWMYEPGIDNTIGNRVTNRTPQMIACRPSQVGGVPSHHNVE